MDRTLYAPGLGYYAAGTRKFGQAGDFVTAPEISSLFGQAIAQALAEPLRQGGGDILELGPGSGKLAIDILQELDRLDALPQKYRLLEVSAELRQRQQDALEALPTHLSTRVEWIDRLPENFEGMVIANEVLDVVPVQLVRFHSGSIFERGVVVKADGFAWQDEPMPPITRSAWLAPIQPYFSSNAAMDYLTEVAPSVKGLVRSLGDILKWGALLFIDYGFRRAEYYHPSRTTGTLMCHYRHYTHTDPFFYPGLQDITAHVDFTAVAEAAAESGLELIGYTSQAQFLLQAGVTDLLAQHHVSDTGTYLPLTNQAQRLLSPAEMGELFKVIGFSRGDITIPALGRARPLPL